MKNHLPINYTELITLSDLLTGGGYEVVEAADSSQTRDVNPVDLIITEPATPGQDAIEAVRALREAMPGVPIIAILVASGGSFLELERLIAADAVIAKPISAEFLLRTVRDVLLKQTSPSISPSARVEQRS